MKAREPFERTIRDTGVTVITGAARLSNRNVIHALNPIYGQDAPSQVLLAKCYRNSLRRAEEQGLRSIAFPSISTGAFGYPIEEAAMVAMETVIDEADRLSRLRRIRFVLFDDQALELHLQAMDRALAE